MSKKNNRSKSDDTTRLMRRVEQARARYAKAEERVAGSRLRLARVEERLARRTARLAEVEEALAAFTLHATQQLDAGTLITADDTPKAANNTIEKAVQGAVSTATSKSTVANGARPVRSRRPSTPPKTS